VTETVRTLRDTGGGDPSVRGVPYASDLGFFTNDAGMPAVLCGPGDLRYAHAVGERGPVSELTAAAVAVLLLRWGRGEA
jgi:acetylornithine deacetylase